MKNLVIVLMMCFMAISCGDKITKKYMVDTKDIDTKLKDHENRITSLETLFAKMNSLESQVSNLEDVTDSNFDAVNSALSSLSDELSNLSTTELNQVKDSLTQLQASLSSMDSSKTEVVEICGTAEKALKSNGKMFAVMSTIETVTILGVFSNLNLENVKHVHLGEMKQGRYMLTDGSGITFSVNEGNVFDCSNQ